MATQIIKHRRGNLEVLKDNNEKPVNFWLLLVQVDLERFPMETSLVFVGIDGSTMQHL